MAYDPQVVNQIIRIGQKRGVPRRHILSALATGIVETGLQNLSYGDADSLGWRQERASLYKNPLNLTASINRYYDEAAQHDRGQDVGELSADIQRPAEQYRGRYAQVLKQARNILEGKGVDLSDGGGDSNFVFGTTDSGGGQVGQNPIPMIASLYQPGESNPYT